LDTEITTRNHDHEKADAGGHFGRLFWFIGISRISFSRKMNKSSPLSINDIPGTNVMILKNFSPKNSAEKLAFLSQNKAKIF
jgi:hypothetical protein